MELTAYLRVIRRRWRLVAVAGLVGLGIGVLTFVLSPKQSVGATGSQYYKATHTLIGSKDVNLTQSASIATTGEVPRRVADRLGGSPGALAASTVASPVAQANLLQITNFSTDPNRAAQVADAFAEELVKYQGEVADRQRQAQIDQYENQREGLRAAYQAVFDRSQADPDKSADKEEQYKKEKDDIVKQGKDLENKVEALRNEPPAPSSLTSLSTADAQPTTQQAMTQALTAPAGKTASASADDASTIDSQVRPARQLGLPARAGIGLGLGLLLGIALTILIERLDPRIRTKEQAEVAYGWPVIAEVPPLTRRQQKEAEVLVFTEPRSRTAEAFRVLRSAVLFASDAPTDLAADPAAKTNGAAAGNGHSNGNGAAKTNGTSASASPPESIEVPHADDVRGDTSVPTGSKAGSKAEPKPESTAPDDSKRGRVILITSPGPSEGKTTTASNLAGAIAETGYKVLIINCDFRRPRLAAFFHRDSGPGEVVTTTVGGVDILNEVIENADHHNPAMVVAAQRKAIHEHVRNYDVIVLDTAPMLTTNDAVDVLIEADAVVVVGRAGKTTREAADRAAEALDRRNAPVIGVVLVGASDSPSGRYYYYGDKNGYYMSRRKRSDAPTALADASRQ